MRARLHAKKSHRSQILGGGAREWCSSNTNIYAQTSDPLSTGQPSATTLCEHRLLTSRSRHARVLWEFLKATDFLRCTTMFVCEVCLWLITVQNLKYFKSRCETGRKRKFWKRQNCHFLLKSIRKWKESAKSTCILRLFTETNFFPLKLIISRLFGGIGNCRKMVQILKKTDCSPIPSHWLKAVLRNQNWFNFGTRHVIPFTRTRTHYEGFTEAEIFYQK